MLEKPELPVRDLDPALLRAFLAIVEAGNFVRAADRLNRTQSALSMQIKRLEELLDVTLFDRAFRPPQLTAAGEKLVPYAREIISLNDGALEDIRSDTIAGTVRLGVMEDLAATHLAPVIQGMRGAHPLVRVDVETGLTAAFVDELGATFDIVVAMTGVDHPEGDLLHRGRSCWIARPDFRVAPGSVLSLALSHRACLFRQWACEALQRDNRRWHVGMVSTSLAALTAFTAEGGSLTVMKDIAVPEGLADMGDRLGLPALPEYEIRLIRAALAHRGAGKVLAEGLAREIPRALRRAAAACGDAALAG